MASRQLVRDSFHGPLGHRSAWSDGRTRFRRRSSTTRTRSGTQASPLATRLATHKGANPSRRWVGRVARGPLRRPGKPPRGAAISGLSASGLRYSRLIDRTRCAREIATRARRFPCHGSTACYEGPLATHPDPAGAIPNRAQGHQPRCRSLSTADGRRLPTRTRESARAPAQRTTIRAPVRPGPPLEAAAPRRAPSMSSRAFPM